MDSEDDMLDANDAESYDDDFYSGETAMDSDDGDAADYEFEDNDSDDSDDPVSYRSQNYTILNEADIRRRQEDNIKKISSILSISSDAAAILLRHYNWSVSKVNDEWFANEEKVRKIVGLLEVPRALPKGRENYTILNEADIRRRQEDNIKKISSILSISSDAAAILLRHYNWSVSKVNDEWFANEEKVRKIVGLLEVPRALPKGRELTCGICFDVYRSDKMSSAACGHPFCVTCWEGYISTAINDGPGCLALRCPDPSCTAAIGQDMISTLVSHDEREKYGRYFLRSFVEDNRKTKWCPAPGCDYAVDFIVGGGTFDVTCRCSYGFCWNCTEEAHRPVDCDTVSKWIRKNSAESENMNWILANSNPCPKCKRPIEKNQGCMHITCTPPCKFEFCWLCLGAWSDHGERTGGFYACNRYEAAKQEGVYDDSEKRREMAKNSLERYTHFYERWATNQSSRQKALADLQQMQNVHLEKLSDKQCQPESQLKFITEAWLQIVECRRVLKWTYAYGYYLPAHENAKRQLFEYLQGEAESGLERLHQCAEKELYSYLNGDGPSKDFNEFRMKLAGLTSVTRNYFENLVRALENGLSDVDARGGTSRAGGSRGSVAGSSKSSRNKGTASASKSRNIDDPGHWSCEYCTFANAKSATVCQMCQQRR